MILLRWVYKPMKLLIHFFFQLIKKMAKKKILKHKSKGKLKFKPINVKTESYHESFFHFKVMCFVRYKNTIKFMKKL